MTTYKNILSKVISLITRKSLIMTTNYTGVCWVKRKNKWLAYVRYNGKMNYCGYYLNDKDAAIARDNVYRFFYNDDAECNFEGATKRTPAQMRVFAKQLLLKQMGKTRSNSSIKTSPYRGVTWDSRSNKWKASINVNRKCSHISLFENDKDAALAYDKVARYMFGKKAITNFDGNEAATIGYVQAESLLNNKRRTSKYRGVHYSLRDKKYLVYIEISKKKIYLGRCNDEIEAALLYNAEAAKHGRPLNVIEGVA